MCVQFNFYCNIFIFTCYTTMRKYKITQISSGKMRKAVTQWLNAASFIDAEVQNMPLYKVPASAEATPTATQNRSEHRGFDFPHSFSCSLQVVTDVRHRNFCPHVFNGCCGTWASACLQHWWSTDELLADTQVTACEQTASTLLFLDLCLNPGSLRTW